MKKNNQHKIFLCESKRNSVKKEDILLKCYKWVIEKS